MTQKETQHFIDKLLEQQATINKQATKIRFLENLIDSLTKELEMCRREGKL